MLTPISFGINTVGVLCTYKVSLAILLEKGGNLALLLDTRKADARRNSNFARFEKVDARHAIKFARFGKVDARRAINFARFEKTDARKC